MILLARVVLAGPGEEDLVHAVRGFARISTPALAVTIFTGFIQMYRLDWGEIFTSSHGRVLFLKSIAVGAMVFLGVAARQFIKERVARVDAMTGQLAVRLRRAVGIEAMCGVVVLALTAWMLSLSPSQRSRPRPTTPRASTATLQITNDVADVTVRFSAVVGPNAVRVEVDKPETGIAGLAVDFSPPAGTTVAGVTLNVPLTEAGVAVLAGRAGMPLGSPGCGRHRALRRDADRLEDRAADRRHHRPSTRRRRPRQCVTLLALGGTSARGLARPTTDANATGLATSSWS